MQNEDTKKYRFNVRKNVSLDVMKDANEFQLRVLTRANIKENLSPSDLAHGWNTSGVVQYMILCQKGLLYIHWDPCSTRVLLPK